MPVKKLITAPIQRWLLLWLLIFAGCLTQAQTPNPEWFEDGRYGMFIHWGLYSTAEGLWKGEKLRYLNDYAEWIRYRNRISKEEYGKLAKRLDWDHINPEEWVLQAKRAGMKYIIITTKHHDGVAIWDTKVNDYSLPKLSGTNRDVIKEIAAAAKKHGIKLGFYYSHWIDWAHPYAWDHNLELTGGVTDKQFNTYWQEKVIPQLRELLTDYGEVALLWFDMWIPYQKSIIKKEQLVQVGNLIRELQPNTLINSRLGLSPMSEYVDFETFGDNSFGTTYTNHPWETPGTIAHSWGYYGQEKEWKSISQIFQSLIGNISLNGGYTLNIGPRGDGYIPYESQTRLNAIGEWLDQYGASVYGNTGLQLRPDQHDWGKITYNPSENYVYLHVFNWPLDKKLRVSGIRSTPKKVELLLKEGHTQSLDFTQNGPLLYIDLPQNQPDPYNSIVRLKIKELELDPDIVAESTFGGFSLNSHNPLNGSELTRKTYDGKKPEHLIISDETAEWEVYLPKKGTYKLDLSSHNPNKEKISVEIIIGDEIHTAELKPGTKVVAEPNENNYTDEFTEQRIGEITISQPQLVNVRFSSPAQKEIWFNWLWINLKGKDQI